jgi:hypothetical protein
VDGRLLQITPDLVDQQSLEILSDLQRQIRSLQQTLDRECCGVVGRIMHGAPVEPGQHTAEVQEQECGATRVFHLVLDGQIID